MATKKKTSPDEAQPEAQHVEVAASSNEQAPKPLSRRRPAKVEDQVVEIADAPSRVDENGEPLEVIEAEGKATVDAVPAAADKSEGGEG